MIEQDIENEVDLDASLAEDGLGFDSMGRLELMHAIEKGLQVDIPEKYWGMRSFKNLKEIIYFISKR